MFSLQVSKERHTSISEMGRKEPLTIKIGEVLYWNIEGFAHPVKFPSTTINHMWSSIRFQDLEDDIAQLTISVESVTESSEPSGAPIIPIFSNVGYIVVSDILEIQSIPEQILIYTQNGNLIKKLECVNEIVARARLIGVTTTLKQAKALYMKHKMSGGE